MREISTFSLLFFLSLRIIFLSEICMAQNTTILVNVGVVLDMDTLVGKMSLSCISMALSDFYASHSYYKTRLILNTRDSKRDVVAAAAAALDLIKTVEAQAILGPETSTQTKFVADLGDKAQVPIITFSATSPSLSPSQNQYLFQATQNDSSQVKAICSLIQSFGWREAVPIYVDNEHGYEIIPYLTDALQEIDTRIPYRSVISTSATDDQIVIELQKLMTMQTRVFIVHMLPPLGSRLFAKAKDYGMMREGYVWIITNGMTNLLGELDFTDFESMQGVLGVKTYVPRTKTLSDFNIRWKTKFQQENPTILDAQLNIFGLWAYDATTALAMAIEKVGTTNFRFHKGSVSGNSTDLENFGISQTGPKLRHALLNTSFRGLSGNYSLTRGELQSSTFQIINMIGSGGREIGYWTPHGLAQDLQVANYIMYNTSRVNLKPIIWPGESIKFPKGWEVSPNGKRLKIGVPVKNGFDEFVKVTTDSTTNTSTFTGYCIDVFKAVVEALPYSISYDFVPFMKLDGEMAGSYDDLVYQVYIKNFDAVVGDITIIANRSFYVDFTLPYTESGVSMIVPIKDNKSKSAWVFLKPLTWDLWVTTGCFFIFIGFIVWVLEHRINEDFRGPPLYQIGMVFWFSFSTMVFANREKVMSNLARFVVIIWVFVVLILTSSYTASLTSMLTVEQLQPTVTDVNELIKKGENVGYLEGSFVLGLLKKLNFDESKLKVYKSPQECDEAFSKGTTKGGIAAAFDEMPYIKVLLSKYCSKYTMVQPMYKTNGFGFGFPKGSPLVADISRAILNVFETEKMDKIEKAWFEQKACPDSSTTVSSNSLSLDSFWGLFLIAGTTSIVALIIFLVTFLHEHKHILMRSSSENSIWKGIILVARKFDKKDLSSHTFRKSELRERKDFDGADTMDAVGASPLSNFPRSPLSFSYHTEGNSISLEGHGTPSPE